MTQSTQKVAQRSTRKQDDSHEGIRDEVRGSSPWLHGTVSSPIEAPAPTPPPRCWSMGWAGTRPAVFSWGSSGKSRRSPTS